MNNTIKNLLLTAGVLGLIAVVIGAFGAHGLKNALIKNNIDIIHIEAYKTGVQYHFYHTFALFISVVLFYLFKIKSFKIASYLFLIGIILFSGSLYLLTLRHLLDVSWSFLGPITPIGGLFFIIAWLFLIIGINKIKFNEN